MGSIKEQLKGVFWCPDCNVPLISPKCYNCFSKNIELCAFDLKPVFKKEKEIFEKFLGFSLPDNLFRSRNRIIHSGKTLFRFRANGNKMFTIEDVDTINSRLENCLSDKNYRKRMIKANKQALLEKEREAIGFIRNVSEENSDRTQFISFSGGKDSAVTALLVKRAIGNVPLFFADTTLEFPETYQYINEFAKKYGFELLTERPKADFFELCQELDPPSQLMRWCCTVFKAYPVNNFYKKLEKNALAFDGIRKAESYRRRDYNRISAPEKIPRQLAAYPIFEWLEADIWFYILTKNIYYNPLYDLGFGRVGCWVCPCAGHLNWFWRKYTHPHLWKKFKKVLENFARGHGKDRNWIDEDNWRIRKAHRSNITTVTTHSPCQSQRTSLIYNFNEPLTYKQLEFLKPFGKLEIESNSMFRIKNNGSSITGILDGTKISVTYNPENFLQMKRLLERQITKLLNCVGCGGCIGSCAIGAIKIENKRFTIDNEQCTNCLKCVNSSFVSYGCVGVSYKAQRKLIG